MSTVNVGALCATVLIAFLASALYYMILAKQRASVTPAAYANQRPSLVQMLAEISKNFIIGIAVSFFVHQLNITTGAKAFDVALILWITFPAMILLSSVIYERVPKKLAFIHVGDWLIKLLLMFLLLSRWR